MELGAENSILPQNRTHVYTTDTQAVYCSKQCVQKAFTGPINE